METDVDVWAVISRYDGYAKAFLPYITAIGVFAAVWFGWERYKHDRAARMRAEPVFEVNQFIGLADQDRIEWHVKVNNKSGVGLTLINVKADRSVFVDKDRAKSREGVACQTANSVYVFHLSRAAVKKAAKVTFFWRWNDEDKIRKTVKKVQLQ